MAFVDDVKVLVKAFLSDITGGKVERLKRMSEEIERSLAGEKEKEMQKEKVLLRFPPQSTGQGVLRDDSASYNGHGGQISGDFLHDGFVNLKLVNKETNLFEEVVAELAMPEVQFPDLNIPPYNAKDIRPVQELVSRFMPVHGLDSCHSCHGVNSLDSLSFARAVAQTFNGKKLTFVVEGLSRKYENDYRLSVSCAEINEAIQKRFSDFVLQLNAIKESFAKQKSEDELLLRPGAKVTGQLLLKYIRWQQYCEVNVKVDGLSVYSAALDGIIISACDEQKIKDLLKCSHEFTVEYIDETSLKAVVSSAEISEAIAGRTTSSLHENSPSCAAHIRPDLLFIDGNNVILHDKGTGWRVLKTLRDWLEANNMSFSIYFDASIDHLEMDADGKEYIKSMINDEKVKKCPAREEADKFILFKADKTGAHILSNDAFRDREPQYPWVNAAARPDAPRRVHKFLVDDGRLVVPDLNIYVPIV